jgi:hypothetical protein
MKEGHPAPPERRQIVMTRAEAPQQSMKGIAFGAMAIVLIRALPGEGLPFPGLCMLSARE